MEPWVCGCGYTACGDFNVLGAWQVPREGTKLTRMRGGVRVLDRPERPSNVQYCNNSRAWSGGGSRQRGFRWLTASHPSFRNGSGRCDGSRMARWSFWKPASLQCSDDAVGEMEAPPPPLLPLPHIVSMTIEELDQQWTTTRGEYKKAGASTKKMLVMNHHVEPVTRCFCFPASWCQPARQWANDHVQCVCAPPDCASWPEGTVALDW